MTPRHEPAYDKGGEYYRASFIEKYGKAGACSYGPLQIMASNALLLRPWTISEIAADPEKAMDAAVAFMVDYVFRYWKCKTLEEICRTWNAGNPHGVTSPGYYEEVCRNYQLEGSRLVAV